MFRWLDEKLLGGEYELSRADLVNYRFGGERLPLLDQGRGIRNPVDFDSTLSIMTSAKKTTYDDEISPDGMVRYSYQSRDGGDNRKLRNAFVEAEPLVYFKGVRDGFFAAYYPVYIVHDDSQLRQVHLALDETLRLFADPLHPSLDERRYAERIVRSRLHQPIFRARVLHAYESACAICSLRHASLLDAAHIISDGEVQGLARVTNGMALCKIHHASYDRNLLGITPDYEVRIDRDLLDEVDGPMLRHRLQDMHGKALSLPSRKRDWPSEEGLRIRYASFAA